MASAARCDEGISRNGSLTLTKEYRPCPSLFTPNRAQSPNGTNYERLYIIRKPLALAMDAAMPKYGSGNNDYPDDVDDSPGGEDTEDKVRQLLEGKLDQADIDALCDLIFPDEDPAPPAQDRGRGRRQAHDRRPVMPSKATMQRLVAEGAVRRADRVLKQHADLMKRFPALRGARVV